MVEVNLYPNRAKYSNSFSGKQVARLVNPHSILEVPPSYIQLIISE